MKKLLKEGDESFDQEKLNELEKEFHASISKSLEEHSDKRQQELEKEMDEEAQLEK